MAVKSQGMLLALASLTATLVPSCTGNIVLFVNVLDMQLEDHGGLYVCTNALAALFLYLATSRLHSAYFQRCGASRQWSEFIGAESSAKTLTHAEIYCQELVTQEALCFAIGFANFLYVVLFWGVSFVVLRNVENEMCDLYRNYVLASLISAIGVELTSRTELPHRLSQIYTG